MVSWPSKEREEGREVCMYVVKPCVLAGGEARHGKQREQVDHIRIGVGRRRRRRALSGPAEERAGVVQMACWFCAPGPFGRQRGLQSVGGPKREGFSQVSSRMARFAWRERARGCARVCV